MEQEECEGIGADGGTEIGFCSKTNRRGLFAADDFQTGDFLVGIPFPCCLTLAEDDIMMGEPTDAELGLRLLNLFNDKSRSVSFQSYFDTFPTRKERFDATPDFWSTKEIEELEFPPIIQKAKKRKTSIEQLAQAEVVDIADLQFATWLVKSRGFTLLKPSLTEPVGNDDNVETRTTLISKTVLMPYLDMINHNVPESANAELQVLETKAEDESFYALQATRSIRKGSEIMITYGTGQESTVDLLLNYGFVAEKNSNDSKFISEENLADFPWSSTLEDEKKALAETGDEIKRKILDFRIRMKKSVK